MQLVKQTNHLAEVLAKKISQALGDNRRVIWLVPGGSNIPISVRASELLDEALTERLVIMQTDERFVDLHSEDCNWHQLKTQGFAMKRATRYPILLPGAHSRDMAVAAYEETVGREFASADAIIGQFGIGPDGHTAGIKPHSPAATSNALVSGYQAEDFERITLTFPAIERVTAAAVFAHGENKRPVLAELAGDSPPPRESFPAGIFCRLTDCVIYNDQIEN